MSNQGLNACKVVLLGESGKEKILTNIHFHMD